VIANATTWVRGRYAVLQYTRVGETGAPIRFRVLDLHARTVIADPLQNEDFGISGNIVPLTNTQHLFVAFGSPTGNFTRTTYLINLRDGSVKDFNSVHNAFGGDFTAANVFADDEGNFYNIASFDAASRTLNIRRTSLYENPSTVAETIEVNTDIIYQNMPDIIKNASTTSPFTAVANFQLAIVHGKPYIHVVGYAIFAGMVNPNVHPLFDLETLKLVYGHYFSGVSAWAAYPGVQLMGVADQAVINATLTEVRLWGGAVPRNAKTAVGRFPTIVKTDAQALRLTYTFLTDAGDFQSKLTAPFHQE
jgi:hypothetical protein